MEPNQIYVGDAREVMASWPANCIDMIITSPPYWAVRKYGTDPVIWGGSDDCEHVWNDVELKPKGGKGENANVGANRNNEANMRDGSVFSETCVQCGAWKGELGLESDFDDYINHLCEVFDEVRRVTKDTGSLYVNIGDTYYSNHGGGNAGKVHPDQTEQTLGSRNIGNKLQSTSLVGIPFRFALEMQNRGWVLRNTIIWKKENAMPSSVSSRYTPDFEYVFFFTKSNSTQYWVNDRTMMVTDKKPAGLKGVEGIDWDWFPCPICIAGIDWKVGEKDGDDKGVIGSSRQAAVGGFKNYAKMKQFKQDNVIDPKTGKPKSHYSGFNARYHGTTKIKEEDAESMGSPRARYHRKCRDKKCTDGQKPRTLWKSHKYYFNQQLEPAKTPGSKHVGGAREYAVKTDIKTGQMRNKRCVWTINTKPYPGSHFAVFPEKLLEVPVQASCPEEVCTVCGLPSVPVYVKGEPDKEWQKACGGNDDGKYHGKATKDYDRAMAQNPSDVKRRILESMAPRHRVGTAGCTHVLSGAEQEEERQRIGSHPFRKDACTTPKTSVYQAHKELVGYAGCNHQHARKGIVFDPFFGAGTTALVARDLGRDWIGIDVKEEYKILAEERLGLVPEPIPEEQETLGRWL